MDNPDSAGAVALAAEVRRLRAVIEANAAAAKAEADRLTYELGHRVKNTLSMVQALAGQTLRGAASNEEALQRFGHRILALAHANDAILSEGWTTITMATVADRVLRPHGSPPGPLTITGPEVRIAASAALSLAMALHELATNAKRFGAWSTPGGRVDLGWTLAETTAEPELALDWTETGGGAADAPVRRGFGLRLIEQSLKSAFGRNVILDFETTGFACRVRAPLAQLGLPNAAGGRSA